MWNRTLIRRSFPVPTGKAKARPAPWVFPVPRFTLRMAATILDWALLVFSSLFASTLRVLLARFGLSVSKSNAFSLDCVLILALFFLYFGFCYRYLGTTAGKTLFHLRLERAETRARVGFVRAFLREFGFKVVPIAVASFLSLLPAVRSWLPGAYVLVPCLPVLQALFFGLFRTDGRMLADLLLDTRVVGAPRSGRYARWLGALTSRRSLAFQACLGLALLAARYGEHARWMVADPATLYERFRPAIVRIELTHLGVPVATGTGFFISDDGVLITNDHVLGPALRPGMGAIFHLADGTKLDRFQIGGCSDERNIDLCVARLNVRPEIWLRPKESKVKVGESAIIIGHPLSFDFSLSQGVISGLREDKRSRQANYRVGSSARAISSIQFTAPISPGNSGGPVFNRYGELLGVATAAYFSPETTGLNFGIDQKEVFRYARRFNAWHEPHVESHLIREEQQREETRLLGQVFAPARKALEEGHGLDPAHFRHFGTELLDRKYGFWLPRDVVAPSPAEGCRRGSRGQASVLVCADYKSEGRIQIEVREGMKNELRFLPIGYRPYTFLPYWGLLGVDLRHSNKMGVDLSAPRTESFHCARTRPGANMATGATICTQTAYNVPSESSVTRLVVLQRDEDGVVIVAFGISDSDGVKVREFEGAELAALSFEFEGYFETGAVPTRGVASIGNSQSASPTSTR